MAEFKEVMRQQERMHDMFKKNCNACPIKSFNSGRDVTCRDLMRLYPQEAEELIMKWASEHPVKTNGEVLKEIVSEKFGIDFPKLTGCILFECSESKCEECRDKGFWDREYKGAEQ